MSRCDHRLTHPVARPLVTVSASAAVLIIVLVFGFLVARTTAFTRAELHVDQWLSERHTAFLTALCNIVVVAFEPTVGAVLLVIVAVIVALTSRRLLPAVSYLVITFGTLAGAQIVKWVVQRPRPDATALAQPPGADNSFSYPSGHTTVATVLVVSLVLLLPVLWKWIVGIAGGIVILLVAVSRFYLGSHYPSDVVAAILIGVAGVLLLRVVVGNLLIPLLVTRRARHRTEAPTGSERQP